ncbi:MAG: CoA-binding protein [Planctomycetaceae bacterium]|nr:CoA-binding protein [Planctomycetaceae bacterium]
MSQPTVAILGASQDRQKYGNKSVRAHRDQGYEVYPINPNVDEVEGLKAYPSLTDLPVDSVDRVSVYLPPHIGVTLLEAIKALNPKEVWFNPGSESPELLERARALGLNVIQACSIIAIGESPADHSD